MPARGAHGWIGRQVVDGTGVELGYVASEDERFLTIAEGPAGQLRLARRFVGNTTDRVMLVAPARDMFGGLNVIDNTGEFVGIVRDTMEAEEVLDALIVEDEGGEMLSVLLEDIKQIDEWVDLDVSAEDVYAKQAG